MLRYERVKELSKPCSEYLGRYRKWRCDRSSRLIKDERETVLRVWVRHLGACQYSNTLYMLSIYIFCDVIHGENFMAIFTTLSVIIWFSTVTLGIFATLVYFFYYACGNIRHTEYGNNSHTIDFHTVM